MAIKGKTKKKGGAAKRTTVAPKPIIVERKPPFLFRSAVKRTMLVVLILGVVIGGLRLWQNVSRSNALKSYDRRLTRAVGLLTKNIDASSLTSVSKNSSDFAAGKVTAAQFLALSKQWETDFTQAKAAVSALKGPSQLGDAQQLIAQGIDNYIGAARLYSVAGIQQQLAEATAAKAKAQKDKAFAKILEERAKAERDQVQVIILHADEARSRADAILQLGTAKIDALKKGWGISAPAPAASVPAGIIPS
jgi:hypothetical protein